MDAEELWLASNWPFIKDSVPSPPAAVLEIGCGPHGGFVPRLLALGYTAIGVDPTAPDASEYSRAEFEQHTPSELYDAVIASTSLHHVADVVVVLDRMAAALVPAGVVVVVEWAWEDIDEATARWCFDRLPAGPATSWLGQRRDEWVASGEPWDGYMTKWAGREGLHSSDHIVRALDHRFEPQLRAVGPYFFPDLDGVPESEEQAAIDVGLIRSTAMRM